MVGGFSRRSWHSHYATEATADLAEKHGNYALVFVILTTEVCFLIVLPLQTMYREQVEREQ